MGNIMPNSFIKLSSLQMWLRSSQPVVSHPISVNGTLTHCIIKFVETQKIGWVEKQLSQGLT